MAESSFDQPSALTPAQLRDLYDLSLRLGPLLPPADTAAQALAACAALAGASTGILLRPGGALASYGLADTPVDLDALSHAELGHAALNNGGVALLPSGLPALPSGPALVAALGAAPAPLLLLGGFGPAGPDPLARTTLSAAAPIVAQALARAEHHAEAQAAERDREQMVNLLVHDVRSPLVATHASMEVAQRLLAGRDVPGTVFEALQTGLRSVRTAVELCNDMLEVKRLQSGYRIDRRPIALAGLLADVAQMLRAVAAQRNAMIATEVEPASLVAHGDERLLRRVLINLVANALRFTPDQGLVELSAAAGPGGETLLAVSDNGPGVDPEERERIFAPFVQGSGEVNRGTGLGLHFCRQAVIAHAGAIWVEDRPGGGCRFVVRLPAPETSQA